MLIEALKATDTCRLDFCLIAKEIVLCNNTHRQLLFPEPLILCEDASPGLLCTLYSTSQNGE